VTDGHRDDIALLRGAGLRITSPRLVVLDIVRGGDHLSAETIASAARERLGSVSKQAVYDVLGALARADLVRRIEPAGSPAALYETRVADNHHHIVCRGCGSVTDVDCVTGAAPCLDASDTHGFVVDEAEVTFWGLCPSCQSRQPEEESAAT
jgi:Fur family ferric uptake transcriptional regulator